MGPGISRTDFTVFIAKQRQAHLARISGATLTTLARVRSGYSVPRKVIGVITVRRHHASIAIFSLFLLGSAALGPLSALAQTAGTEPGEFLATETALMAEGQGPTLGDMTPATPVMILATVGDKTEIAVEGWSMRDAPQYLYPEIGQRIVLVTLGDAGQAARVVEASQDDKYGIHWDKVKITGWIPSANLVADPEAVWAAALELFQDRCSACHALHQPTEFTSNQWPSILKIMTKRAALAPDEIELVTKYLQMHAKVPGAGRGPGPKMGSASPKQ